MPPIEETVITATTPAATASPPVEPVDTPPAPTPVNPNDPATPLADTAPETPDAKAGEGKPEEQPPATAPDPKAAARFAALARREKEITAKAAEWKPKFEAAERFEAARAKVKEDPYAALDALGLNLQDLVDAAIHHNKPETVEDRVARLEAERAEAAKARESSSAQAVEETISRYKQTVSAFVDADPEAYELIVARRAHGLVFDVIEEHYKATGQVLPNAQAADMVENHLLEEARSMLKLKKLSNGAPVAAPAVASTNGVKASPPSLSAQAVKPNPTPPSAVPEYESHDAAITRIAAKLAAAGNART